MHMARRRTALPVPFQFRPRRIERRANCSSARSAGLPRAGDHRRVHRWPASCARWKPRARPACKLIVGSEITLRRRPEAGAAGRGRRPATRTMCQLITHGPRRAAKGAYRLHPRRSRRRPARRCCALWMPGEHAGSRKKAAGCARCSATARGWRWNCIAAPMTMHAWQSLLALAADARHSRWWPAATCTCTCAAGARAGHDDRDPPSHHHRARPARGCFRNGERHLRTRARAGGDLSAAAARTKRCASPSAARSTRPD